MNGDADDPTPEIELIRQHGSGLYGVVWEGKQVNLNRKVAVKFIKSGLSHWANLLEHALARVRHQNVVTVYQVTRMPHPTSGDLTDCSVMEWREGTTLSRLRGDRFSIAEAVEVATAILDGVEAIHAEGIAHTDLLDENILLAPKVKIIDINYEASKSLAVLSSTARATRLVGDIESAGVLLGDIFRHSTAKHEALSKTVRQIRQATTIGELQTSVGHITKTLSPFACDKRLQGKRTAHGSRRCAWS